MGHARNLNAYEMSSSFLESNLDRRSDSRQETVDGDALWDEGLNLDILKVVTGMVGNYMKSRYSVASHYCRLPYSNPYMEMLTPTSRRLHRLCLLTTIKELSSLYHLRELSQQC